MKSIEYWFNFNFLGAFVTRVYHEVNCSVDRDCLCALRELALHGPSQNKGAYFSEQKNVKKGIPARMNVVIFSCCIDVFYDGFRIEF